MLVIRAISKAYGRPQLRLPVHLIHTFYCDFVRVINIISSSHEQHERAASYRSRFKSLWETPTSTPRGAQTSWGIELKIGRINYVGGLTGQAKFQICTPSGVLWAMG